MSGKEQITYDAKWNPKRHGVTHVSIQERTKSVFHTFQKNDNIPTSGYIPGVNVFTLEEADEKYEFVED